jgi:hypothetical protein
MKKKFLHLQLATQATKQANMGVPKLQNIYAEGEKTLIYEQTSVYVNSIYTVCCDTWIKKKITVLYFLILNLIEGA